MAQAFGVGGFGSLEEQVRRNMELFERTFAMFAPFARRGGGEQREKPDSEIDELKHRLNEIQRSLEGLTAGGRTEQSIAEIDEIRRQLGEIQQRLEQLTGAKGEA